MAVANIHTAEKYGPDRVIGFSPIPAMSMLSYAAGSRFLQLFGGVNLSFYDWYCDLPTAFPEIWGEQTDVCESADWYNAKMIADMGACLNMTRTPDCHFFAESRHNGTKAVVFSPDFSQVCKYADQWVPLHAGSDGAFWMASTHVILKEFHHQKQTPFFLDYVKKLHRQPLSRAAREGRRAATAPGACCVRPRSRSTRDLANGEWKFVNLDAATGRARRPQGELRVALGRETGQLEPEVRERDRRSAIRSGADAARALRPDRPDELRGVRARPFGAARRAGDGDRDRPTARRW